MPDFVGREKKGQAALRRLCFRETDEVGKTCLWRQAGPNGGTSRADRRSVSAKVALEWKGFSTSAGAWNIKGYRIILYSI
ncbi:hypothetical protein QSE00_22510 [Arenibacter sp. M-2]|uniref:hypothetical protein n=1 Tax=Arenibacter sp. M-2 TaxID=3053612 RepID=UPI00256FD843|nr:hypothetical protein [Arenibacter sp. M-2]MDL5514602.1 hypothetical protein [Arenibacter sp. M-2]